MNKKTLSIIIILLGVCLIVFGFVYKTDDNSNSNSNSEEPNNSNSNNNQTNNENIIKYEYRDNSIPGENYKIELNKDTKELKGEFYHACSAENCEGKTYNYTITLTDEELTKVLKLWDEKEYISPILECLCENDMIMYNSFEDSFGETKEEYNLMDKNSDGKVTKREFGNVWLDYALEEVQ